MLTTTVNLITVIFLTQLNLVVLITVPPVWPRQNEDIFQLKSNNHFYDSFQNEHTTSLPLLNPKYTTNQQFKYKSVPLRPLYRIQNKNKFHPRLPLRTPLKPNKQYRNRIHPPVPKSNLNYRPSNNIDLFIYHPQPSRNARIETPHSYQTVDKTEHDPNSKTHSRKVLEHKNNQDKNTEEDDDDSKEEIEQEQTPISEHELPIDVPTRPIYPGEGQWAKFGLKHKPYIRPSSQITTENHHDDDEKIPDGYDTFERGEENFQRTQNEFNHDLNAFPERHQLNSSPSQSEDESEPLYDKPELGFVPEKLYTQVRKYETEEHLPRSSIDPELEENASRLREVIKDSRIHTVYTEEGYEDGAYDHAGHEKEAEHSEGHAQSAQNSAQAFAKDRESGRSKYTDEGGKKYGKNTVTHRLKSDERDKNEDYSNLEKFKNTKKFKNHQDIDSAGSENIPSKKVQKVTLKNADKNIDMEIHTEIKYITGPEKKKHKFVKIFPSSKTQNTTTIQKIFKRVKRYDKEELSKRYIRTRPNYYWKKKKSRTTERPRLNIRQNIEDAFNTNKNSNSRPPKQSQKSNTLLNSKASISTPNYSSSTLKSTQSITKSTTITPLSTTILTPATPDPQDVIPLTTPKPSKLDSFKRHPVIIKKYINKRQKRYTIDHPDLSIDLKEFVDVSKLKIPPKKPDLTHQKYPYYKLPVNKNLHENSPLRYAEDLANIPPKTENDMAFYESRDNIRCEEIESDLDPIPDRIKNQKEGEETDQEAETPELPRIKGLGDKIDCLKEKYFGENPLDSPFFKEETISDPIAFFSVNKKNQLDSDTQSSEINLNKREFKSEVLNPIIVEEDDYLEAPTTNPIHKNTEAVLKPPYTLTEMMKRLRPKSIYDQISLLESEDHSPASSKTPQSDKFVIIYDKQDKKHPLERKIGKIKPPVNGYKTPKVSDIISDLSKISEDIPKPDILDIVPKNTTEKDILYPEERTSAIPEVTTFKSRTVIARRPKNTLRKLPNKKILRPQQKTNNFNLSVNITLQRPLNKLPVIQAKFTQNHDIPLQGKSSEFEDTYSPQKSTLTTAQSNINEKTSTSLPIFVPDFQIFNRRISPYDHIFDINKFLPKVSNHKIINSEVHYKDEIKPSDQMQVYNDVLKTINNSEKMDEENASNMEDESLENSRPKLKKNPKLQTAEKQSEEEYNEDYNQEASEKIVGMLPPSQNKPYRTILLNVYDQSGEPSELPKSSRNINQFYVRGLKPPVITKKIFRLKRNTKSTKPKPKPLETDDLMMEESRISENYLHLRKKREQKTYAQPPSRKPVTYTEIKRVRPVTTEPVESNEDEDLNPRKRIYELKPRYTTTARPDVHHLVFENDEEIVFEEDPLELSTEPTTTSKPVFYPVEANKDDPSLAQYVFLIERLHEKWAKEEPSTTEPPLTTTTEKPQIVMTQTASESVNIRRGEPAYLQIINQLHEIRKDEDPKTSTTTETIIEDDSPAVTMKNSNPFLPETFASEISSMQSNLDSSEEDSAARIRNLSAKFKTSIDTSKYKTIERNPVTVRYNLSSRFNSEDELPLSRGQTSQIPKVQEVLERISILEDSPEDAVEKTVIPLEISTKLPEINIKEVFSTSSTTTTTKLPTTTRPDPTTARTRSRIRFRTRPTTTSTTTIEPVVSTTTNPLFKRRRPLKLTTTSTTTTENSVKPEIKPGLTSRRRSRFRLTSTPETPSNHRSTYTSVNQSEKPGRKYQKIEERRVMSEVTLTRFYAPDSGEIEDENLEETKKHQYEVVGPLLQTDKGHGGNYKHTSDATTDVEPFYTDTNLAVNVNQLKDEISTVPTTTTVKNLIEEKVTQKPVRVNLYPNMARMVNRLAESQTEPPTSNNNNNDEDNEYKPTFIKDPSQRMYYYAKL